MDRFESIHVGQQAELTRRISERDVQIFCEFTGDNNPLHTDPVYAAKTPLRKCVAHGMLTASFISTLIGTILPGPGSLWFSQSLFFLAPVRIGDTVKFVAVVTQKSPGSRAVTLDVKVFNQHGQKVLEGQAVVKVMAESRKEADMRNPERGGAIVTGASRGIGAATALRLGSDGFLVIVNYRQCHEKAEEVVKQIVEGGGEALAFQADVRDAGAVRRMVEFARERYGPIEVLVNNAAGPLQFHSLEQLTWESVLEHLVVQLEGALHTCQAVIPGMVARKHGRIVNVGSIASDNVPPEKMYAYVMTKAALAAFTRSLAVEFGPKGLNVNCVAPGMTETDLIADVPERTRLLTSTKTALRRLATPEDVASVVAFLTSDAAKYITGETIRVCGGQMML